MLVVSRTLKPYLCSAGCVSTIVRQYASPAHSFPVITPPPVCSYSDSEINRDLYGSVVSLREKVWSGDKRLSATPREGRKLTLRERIDLLRDEGSEVVHIGTLAGLNMSYGDVLNAGNEVAIVTICGEVCMVSGNDWTLKGGTVYPIGVKKQLRGQEIAKQNRLPCIYLADSGGAFLPLQSGLYPDKEHGGRVFRNQAVLSSLGIPQVAVVVGPCTAGGAYIPAMSDEAVIVQDIGSLYIAGPPLVKAATGVVLSSEELGGAKVHCTISGCTDHYALTEEEGMEMARGIVASLNLSHRQTQLMSIEDPLYGGDDDDFSQLIPTEGPLEDWPILNIISRLVDGSRLRQFKEHFGTNLVTGFARVNGHLVGVVASHGVLSGQACLKGAHFIRLCELRSIPLLFLVNTPSEEAFLSPNGSEGLAAKGRAQMMATLATTTVPKITIVLGGSYGPSSYAMCGRSMEPNFLFHWPHARSAIAQPEHILAAIKTQDGNHGNEEAVLSHLSSEERTRSTSDLCNDGVILPSETRKVIGQCLDVCTTYPRAERKADLSLIRM